MSSNSINTSSSSYTVLKHKDLYQLPPSITCFALNYVTHRLLLCNKERVFLYDLCANHIIRKFSYAKEFSEIYDNEIEIKAADAVILSNLWITLVNKKSFLFFNDRLEFSRVYSSSPNPLLSIQVLQRTNDLLTFREDHKAVKIWKFELSDNVAVEKSPYEIATDMENRQDKDHKKKQKRHSKREKAAGTETKQDDKQEKQRRLKELGMTFEVNIFMRKQLHIPLNRFLVQLAFSEELRIVALALDSMEVMLYNILSGEHLQTLTFSTPNEKESNLTPHVSIDQEMLYYCDERRVAVYDLVMDQEIINQQHTFTSKIVGFHAERANNNAGIYILTADEKLHVYSIALKKLLCTEDLKNAGLESNSNTVLPTDSSSRGHRITFNFNQEAKSAMESGETTRRDNLLRDLITKGKYQMATDLSVQGLTTLFICKPGFLCAYDVMSSAKVLFNSASSIQKMSLALVPVADQKTSSKTIEDETHVRLEFANFTTSDYLLQNFSSSSIKSSQNLLALWKQSNYEHHPNNDPVEELKAAPVLEICTLLEEKLFVVITQTYLHVVSIRANRMLSQNLIISDVSACMAIVLSYDTFGNYYVILGTKKGTIIVLECDFALRTLNVVKHMPKHTGVLALRHLRETNQLMSIGTEGDIFLYAFTKPNEVNLFPTQQNHRLIWNHVTSIAFLNDKEIIAGLDNGAIQHVKYSWKTEKKLDSRLLEYHTNAIQHIAVPSDTEMFVACCADSVVTCWNTHESVPQRVFRLGEPVISLMISLNHITAQTDIFVAMENMVVKLDYEQGNSAVTVNRDDEEWSEALSHRTKYYARSLREGKTLNSMISKVLATLLEYKKHEKESPLSHGPLLNKHLYHNPRYTNSKSLEADYVQYVTAGPMYKRTPVAILDAVLSGFCQRKLAGEPLTLKAETNKLEKKPESRGSLTSLITTALKKYPMIKSVLMEKQKAKELEEMHKNTVLLLNMTYEGEDDLEKQYQYLEDHYKIKRETLDEAYFRRAKVLHYKKPAAFQKNDFRNTTQDSNLLTPRKDLKAPTTSRSPLKLPGLDSSEKKYTSPDVASITDRKSTKHKKVVVPKLKHFKNYSEEIEKGMMRTAGFPSETLRALNRQNEYIHRPVLESSSYQSFSSIKTKVSPMKLNLNLGINTTPRLPAVMSSRATPRTAIDEKLAIAIGQEENTIRTPFFVTSRADMNKDIFPPEFKQFKSSSIPNVLSTFNNTFASTFNSPQRPAKDFVALHSKGFKSKDNVDMFNHVLRLLLKNHYLLKNKQAKKPENISPTKRAADEDSEDDIEYVPIEIKQYILEVNQKQMEILEDLISVYEMKTGNKINADSSKPDPGYSPTELEEEMDKENEFMEQILERVNQQGIESIGMNQMVRFKQIMRRRVEMFSHLQTHLEVSGLLRTNPVSAREVQLKEELMRTFHQVKEIADLKTALFPVHISPKIKSPASDLMSNGSQLLSSRPWVPSNIGVKEAQVMLESIKRSIENVKALDGGASSAFDKYVTQGSSPRNLDSFRNLNFDMITPRTTTDENSASDYTRRTAKAMTTAVKTMQAVRSWNEVLQQRGKGESKTVIMGKPGKIKRRYSFNASPDEIKKMLKGSTSKLDSPDKDKPNTGTPGARTERTGSAGGPRLERQGTFVGKGIRSIGDEEVSKKIEKAWKEKDFAYLREFLSQKTTVERYGTENSNHEKKETEHVKTLGDEDKGNEGADVKNAKKKKKKRNPNIGASSGNVVTTTKLKMMKQEDEQQRTAREGTMYDDRMYENREEDEDEEEQQQQQQGKGKGKGKDKDKIVNLTKKKTNDTKALEAKKIELLNHPTKENVHKKINYKFHQASPMAKHGAVEEMPEINPSNTASNSAAQTQQGFMPGQMDKSQVASEAGSVDQKDKNKGFQALNQGNIAKIHKRNDSFRSREQLIEKLQGGKSDETKPQEPTTPTAQKKHKPKIKSKYDLGKIDAFTMGDETKTITFGDESLKTKKTEEPEVDLEKKLLELKRQNTKPDIKLSESLDVDVPVRRAVTVRKQENIDLLAHIAAEAKEKKPSRFNKLSSEYKAASFTENRKKVNLIVKGEDKNPDSDDSTRKGKGKANADNSKKGRTKASRFAKEKEKNAEDEVIDRSHSGSYGRDDLYGSDDFFPSSGDPTKIIGSDEPKTFEDGSTMNKDQTRTEFAASQMPSIAEKLDKVPKLASTKSKRSMKKKGTTGVKATTSTEESKEPTKDEKAPEGEDANKIEDLPVEETEELDADGKPKKPKRLATGEEPVLEKQRTVRHFTQKQRGQSHANVEDILDDPLKLFQVVMNDVEVDQETKLDLFFYGNRKEALKEFVKEIEDTIEHNIIKNSECNDMLADFFDAKMNSLLVSKAPLVKQGKNNNQFARKYTFPQNVGGYDYDDLSESFMNQRSSQENEAENSRRIAFQFQQTLLNNMRASASSYCTPLSQANIGPKSKKGQIILSPSAFETLVQRKDEILLDQFMHQKDDLMNNKTMQEEKEEADLLARLERLRRLLIKLRESDPEEFERLLLLFRENKKLYQIVMKEADARDKEKKNILI